MNLNSAHDILIDLAPKTGNIVREILTGLSKNQKVIDPKYLYDKKGSEIFEQITKLPEYYPTRAENEILVMYADEISKLLGPKALFIEPGSGSGKKIRLLLNKLDHPAGYVPIEISREALLQMTAELHAEYPDLQVTPVCADFTQSMDFPLSIQGTARKVIFFPGSTIGNFHPDDAISFLKSFSKIIENQGKLLIGVDLKKDKMKFQQAYDDPKGLTAAFNLNLLDRLNREVGASFDTNNFQHVVRYNEDLGRVEMHLKSNLDQLVRVNQTVFRFKEGETIHTECSYKYTVEEFCELAAKAGLTIEKFWIDPDNLFCVYLFQRNET